MRFAGSRRRPYAGTTTQVSRADPALGNGRLDAVPAAGDIRVRMQPASRPLHRS